MTNLLAAASAVLLGTIQPLNVPIHNLWGYYAAVAPVVTQTVTNYNFNRLELVSDQFFFRLSTNSTIIVQVNLDGTVQLANTNVNEITKEFWTSLSDHVRENEKNDGVLVPLWIVTTKTTNWVTFAVTITTDLLKQDVSVSDISLPRVLHQYGQVFENTVARFIWHDKTNDCLLESKMINDTLKRDTEEP